MMITLVLLGSDGQIKPFQVAPRNSDRAKICVFRNCVLGQSESIAFVGLFKDGFVVSGGDFLEEWVGVVESQRCTGTPGSSRRCQREGGGEGGGRRGERAAWQIRIKVVEGGRWS